MPAIPCVQEQSKLLMKFGEAFMRNNILAAVCLATSFSALAKDLPLTVSIFQGTKDNPVVMAYISGVGQGYLYANTKLLMDGKRRMYCQPTGLALIGKNYVQLIETEIQRPSAGHAYSEKSVIEIVLLNALMANFPCEK